MVDDIESRSALSETTALQPADAAKTWAQSSGASVDVDAPAVAPHRIASQRGANGR